MVRLSRKRTTQEMPDAEPEPTLGPTLAMTAAVAQLRMDGTAWRSWKFGDRAWQADAWRLYDITGQLRFVANWAGNSVSRCRLVVKELDDDGEPTIDVDDPEISSLAKGPLGTGAAKDESLRLLGIHLFVPGEGFVIAEADGNGPGDDRWFVVSGSQISKQGDKIRIKRSQLQGSGTMEYREGTDLILRCWTPHPRDSDEPDSPTRSAIPDLREIEANRKRAFAEMDSRLAGAGLLALPEDLDFPRREGEAADPATFAAVLMRTMAASLADRSAAEAMVPLILQGKADSIDKIKHITFWSELSDQLLPLRKEAIRSLAQSLDIPPEVLLGLGDTNHWCTVGETEILTRDGWRTYDQLTIGEDVLTLDHRSGLSQWQPVDAINTWQVDGEEMIQISGNAHHSVTTAAHRWPTLSGKPRVRGRAWTTSADLAAELRHDDPEAQRQQYLILAAPHGDLPAEPKYSDALVELVAWYYTEGDRGTRAGRHTPRIVISQSTTVNADNCARIERALTSLFGPQSPALGAGGRYATAASAARNAQARQLRAEHPDMPLTEIGRRLGVSAVTAAKYLKRPPRVGDSVPRWRRRADRGGTMNRYLLNAAAATMLLEHAPGRVVSLDFVAHLTSAQLELFIDTSIRADGWRIGGRTAALTQKDPARLDAFELAAILSGRSPYRCDRTTTGRTARGETDKTLPLITASDRTTFAPRGRSITTYRHTGTIWCPTTGNGTWLARHNGTVFYTGNSAWAISEEAITTQIVPILTRIADALTVGYLRHALAEMGKDPDRYVYTFDTAPLTTRPNRVADGLQYHEKGLISDEAAREAGAFSDDDAPEPDEVVRRLVQLAVQQNPALITDPVVAQILGIPPIAAQDNPGTRQIESGPGTENQPDGESEPDTQPGNGDSPPAQDGGPSEAALFPAAGQAVRRALGIAGSRLVPHTRRDRYPGTAKHALHVQHGAVSRDRAVDSLRGVWDDLGSLADDLMVDRHQLQELLDGFCIELLTRGLAYDPADLRAVLRLARAQTTPAPVGSR